ncbi:MAG: hypothetical protein OQL19_14505 [Gammaproteobacteria bacterium]|nr:hypothetical protein [Gammaproteobacteria bacterium]
MKQYYLKAIRVGFISALFSMTSSIVLAEYIAGEEANKRGDRQTAFNEFYAAAQEREPRAYGRLGSMYLYGLGTKKDYQQAYIWFHMGYLSGERESERFRDAASSMMNREDYLKAVEAAEAQRVKQQLGTAPPQQMPPVAPRAPS